MKNNLVEKLEKEFERLGFPETELLYESYSEASFGNAQAIYKLENLHLYFLRDRSEDTVNFLNPDNLDDRRDYYAFGDISVLMGWTTLEKEIAEYKAWRNTLDFSKPNVSKTPQWFVPLGDAIELIRQDYEQLQYRFSPSKLGDTLRQLKDIERKRCKALFGREPPQ